MSRAGITPRRVAEVGAVVADELGFDRVTAAEVARRFGVQTASLYSHVQSTADLKRRVALFGSPSSQTARPTRWRAWLVRTRSGR